MKPLTAFFCALCKETILERADAEQHVKGHEHYVNFKVSIQSSLFCNPNVWFICDKNLTHAREHIYLYNHTLNMIWIGSCRERVDSYTGVSQVLDCILLPGPGLV